MFELCDALSRANLGLTETCRPLSNQRILVRSNDLTAVAHQSKRGIGMKLRTILTVALVLAAALPFAQGKDKKKKTMPAVFATARYVYVQAEDGDAFKPGLLDADRQAIVDLQNALRDWHRYSLTMNSSEADLIFIVRKGRIASGQIGATVGTGSGPGTAGQSSPFPGQRQAAGGIGLGGEVGPPDDYLEVRMRNPESEISAPIWERSQQDGLDAPKVPLLRMLRDAVEKDYPQ